MSNRSVPANISCHGNGVFREIDSQRRLVKRREDCLKLGVCHTHKHRGAQVKMPLDWCFSRSVLEAGVSSIPGIHFNVDRLVAMLDDAHLHLHVGKLCKSAPQLRPNNHRKLGFVCFSVCLCLSDI